MKFIIPGRSISWNAIYASRSPWVRKHLVDQVHLQVQDALLEAGILPNKEKNLFKYKVDIHCAAYFKSKPLDSDNIVIKLICDAMKNYLIIDDSIEYVGRVSSESHIGIPERIEVTITESLPGLLVESSS